MQQDLMCLIDMVEVVSERYPRYRKYFMVMNRALVRMMYQSEGGK